MWWLTPVKYNERKEQVLEYVRENKPVTSREVARDLDLEVHNARTLLAKYTRFGLLRRMNPWGKRGYPFEYELTSKGEKRLMWLLGIFETPTPELSITRERLYPERYAIRERTTRPTVTRERIA